MASSRAVGTMAKRSSTAILRTPSRPSPAILAPFSTDEWASSEQYTLSSPPPARSRAVTIAHNVAAEAVSWMTPWNSSGRPIMARSHSIIRVSSSVAAGEVCQLMHCAPRAAVSISASTEGGLALAGK